MKKFFIVLIATVTTYNCESDDLCPESTLTTPRMIITFYDVNNPEERKNVESLGVYIIKNSEFTLINEINGINTDSIAIPLRDDESVSNFKLCLRSNYSLKLFLTFIEIIHECMNDFENFVLISKF